MRKILVLAAAGTALAIGVPAAVALGDSPSPASTAPIQNAQPERERPNRDDCPEKDGREQRGSSASAETPEI
jgi:hypothetical protein